MSISAPVILLPSGGADYTTDIATQTLSGTTSANTAQILVNGTTAGVSYTPGETPWAWSGTLAQGANTIQIVAVEQITGDHSQTTTIVVILTSRDMSITVSAPTGVSLKRYQDKIEIICIQNPEINVIGYNFYVSYQSGGVNNEYVQINPQQVTEVSSYADTSKQISQTVNAVGNIRVTTTTEEVDRTYYFSYFFTKDQYTTLVQQGLLPDVGFNQEVPFYFVITAVIYDSVFGQVTESTYSPELEGSVITITTGIQDLPLRTQSDVILTYIKELQDADAGIDMKPGTVLRDITNPISEETARVYVIQDFLSRSLSISALQDFDDANNDGVSDPVSQSVRKRALQIALYLTDPNQVQQIIDDQFDKLAANVNVIRRGATKANGSVVFYIETMPLRDMQVSEGAIVTSLGNVDQGIASQSYTCTETKILQLA